TIARIPVLSVVVPAHNNERTLPRVLAALAASTLPRESWELIVVDDGSRDGTDVVAATHADVVVRLNGDGRGPAYARNRGVEFARGEIVVFVDADVCVHPDALEQFLAEFRVGDVVGAVFGSYDLNPPAPGFVSQYRNLLHHYHHQTNAGEAQTFWAGCGAVRRSVFIAAGMYDEWRFPRPQIEDIELGNRIHALGHRIVLQPAMGAAPGRAARAVHVGHAEPQDAREGVHGARRGPVPVRRRNARDRLDPAVADRHRLRNRGAVPQPPAVRILRACPRLLVLGARHSVPLPVLRP